MRRDTENVFYSKVDAWLVWLFGGAFALAACAAFFLLWDGDYCAFAAFALFDIFVFSIVFYGIWNCRYVFGEACLEIRVFWSIRIPYSDIRNFRDTFDIMSAPACSLDRMEISYVGKSGKRLSVCVSPRDKRRFSEMLAARMRGE